MKTQDKPLLLIFKRRQVNTRESQLTRAKAHQKPLWEPVPG